ncbi:uncharacterized protein [Montipora capricornis]|uniref:uncharacterized protein n=1 Tax=Montipora capricornis TaxID=246305 RepID=UPI0035F1DC3A
MENLLQNIPHVIVRVDDILVSGANDDAHLRNLEEILKRLAEAGLRLKKGKCVFMESQVLSGHDQLLPEIPAKFVKRVGPTTQITQQHFAFETDHRLLESLCNEKKAIPTMAAAPIQRWALTLAAYNYTIKYKPDKEHCNADALSRLPLPVTPRMTPVAAETVWTMELLNSTPVGVKAIQAGTRSDSTLSQVTT